MATIMGHLGMEEGQPIEHGLITKAIENAQKKVEAHHFDIRKHLLEYDDVMSKHREIVYSLRRQILDDNGGSEVVQGLAAEELAEWVARFVDPKSHPSDWDLAGLKEQCARVFGFLPRLEGDEAAAEARGFDYEELQSQLQSQVQAAWERKKNEIGENDFKALQRYILLQVIDHRWLDHLQDMEHMKEGIGLRGYGQLDPLREYKKEGYALFEELMTRIRTESLTTLGRVSLVRQKRPEEAPTRRQRAMQFSHGEGEKPVTVKREGKKIGRNDPCPCGSGKKYKKCCGMNQ
jgi:preprotein translocase subunit SecA